MKKVILFIIMMPTMLLPMTIDWWRVTPEDQVEIRLRRATYISLAMTVCAYGVLTTNVIYNQTETGDWSKDIMLDGFNALAGTALTRYLWKTHALLFDDDNNQDDGDNNNQL